MTQSPLKRIALRFMLAVVGLGLGLLLGELGLRALGLPESGPFLQEFRGERFKVMSYDENPTGAFDLDFSNRETRERVAARLHDPDEFEKSWQETPYGVAFELNAMGFRERPFRPRQIPRGQAGAVRRIVVVGDSFTVGHGLPNSLAYPRRLEAALGEGAAAAGDQGVEVFNLGQGDTDLKQVLRVAGFGLQRLDPDVLIYGYFLNDPLRTLEAHSDRQVHDMLDAGWTTIEQSPTTLRIGQSVRGASRVLDLIRDFRADRVVTDSTVDWYQRLHQPEAWRPTRDQILRLSEAAKRRDVRFIVLLLPLPFQISEGYPFAQAHRDMARMLGEADIEVVDALPALMGSPDAALRLHPRDRHPSPLYTDLVSTLLVDRLSLAVGRVEKSP